MDRELTRQSNPPPEDTTEVHSCQHVSSLSELFCRCPITPDIQSAIPPPPAYKNLVCLGTMLDSSGDACNDETVPKYLKCLQSTKLVTPLDGLKVNCPTEMTMPSERRFSNRHLQLEGTFRLPSSKEETELGLKRHLGEEELGEEGSIQENGLKRLKKGANRENTAVLRSWLDTHRSNPYPTKDERDMLAVVTGLSQQQISTWFANARRRLKKQNPLIRTTRNHRLLGVGSDLWQQQQKQMEPQPPTTAVPDSAALTKERLQAMVPATPTTYPFHASPPPYCPETTNNPPAPADMTRLLTWAQEQLRVINWFNLFTQFYHQTAGGGGEQRCCAELNPSLAPLLAPPSDSVQLFGSPESARRSNLPERGLGRSSEDSGRHKKGTTDSPIWSVAKIALSGPRYGGPSLSFRLEPSTENV